VLTSFLNMRMTKAASAFTRSKHLTPWYLVLSPDERHQIGTGGNLEIPIVLGGHHQRIFKGGRDDIQWSAWDGSGHLNQQQSQVISMPCGVLDG
jgi:hypothetical protein